MNLTQPPILQTLMIKRWPCCLCNHSSSAYSPSSFMRSQKLMISASLAVASSWSKGGLIYRYGQKCQMGRGAATGIQHGAMVPIERSTCEGGRARANASKVPPMRWVLSRCDKTSPRSAGDRRARRSALKRQLHHRDTEITEKAGIGENRFWMRKRPSPRK